jgi:hypothetical protein
MKIQDHKHDRSKTQAEGSTWGNLTVPSAFLLGLERRSLWDFGLSNIENIDGTLENEETGQCQALESRSGKNVRTRHVAMSSSITTWRFFSLPSA